MEETVNAEDGKQYTFGARAKVKKLSSIKEDGSVNVKFVFRNGKVREHFIAKDDPLYPKFAAHGADQKFGDEFAGLEDVEDCIEAFDDLSARLSKGEWSERRVAAPGAGTSLLVQALCAVTGKSADEVRARLATLTPETKKALAVQPKVQAEILRIKAQRLSSTQAKEADAVLEELRA